MKFERDLKRFAEKIEKCCDKETCYFKVREAWSEDNKLLGHCAVVSLLANVCLAERL